MIFILENAKVITNFTTNWCCNECDQLCSTGAFRDSGAGAGAGAGLGNF